MRSAVMKIALGAVAALILSTTACAPVESTPEDKAAELIEEANEPASKAPKKKAEPVEKKPSMTAGQANAVRSASDYLDYSAFSRSGLIEQLGFEGYSVKDAEFAVDALRVNWKEQAVKAAKEYLSYSGFSRSGLIEQLMFEGYTRAQANHGADAAGL